MGNKFLEMIQAYKIDFYGINQCTTAYKLKINNLFILHHVRALRFGVLRGFAYKLTSGKVAKATSEITGFTV